MVKSVICIVSAVFLIIINTVILFLKPEFTYARNDEDNYCVYYQKWIRTLIFMGTIIIALFSIYFAVNLLLKTSLLLLTLECVLVICYALCKYKGITVNGEEIIVERLFRNNLKIKFSNISSAYYVPNAKIVVKVRRKENFDVSFNSENFHSFYKALIKHNIKFKTSNIPNTDNRIYIERYDMVIKFPKTMFREFYQSERFLRNSKYLFSARSLENNEYIEGYIKQSGKNVDDFIDYIKNDLNVNEFKYQSKTSENIDGYDFMIIKSIDKTDNEKSRKAYIYQDKDNYLVIYADYLTKNEEAFTKKMTKAIHRALYEDAKSRFVTV